MVESERSGSSSIAAVLACMVLACMVLVLPVGAQNVPPSQTEEVRSEQAAVLVDWEGMVTVTRWEGGDRVPADYLMQLFDRDVVRTGPGSSATVYYHGGQAAHLGENSTVPISAMPSASDDTDPERASVKVPSMSELRFHSASRGEVSPLGGLRTLLEQGVVRQIRPLNTAIRDRPTFVWEAPSDADRVFLRVLDASGVLWERAVSGPSLTYPLDAPALHGGRDYVWEIVAESGFESVSSGKASFRILSSDEAGELEGRIQALKALYAGKDGLAYDFVLGAVLIDSGLLDAAAEVYESLASAQTSSELLQEILVGIYVRMGDRTRALEHLERLVELRGDR